jgi:hypothetical protein
MQLAASRGLNSLGHVRNCGTHEVGRRLSLWSLDFQLAELSDELEDLLLKRVDAACQFAPVLLILASETQSAFGDYRGRQGEGEDQNNEKDFHGRNRATSEGTPS